MSRFSELKAAGTGDSVFQLPDQGQGRQACGGEPQAIALGSTRKCHSGLSFSRRLPD